jgi:hypothetical protein
LAKTREPSPLLMYLPTVLGDSRIWSFSNSSSAMRRPPQVGFSAAIWRINLLTSNAKSRLPADLDFQRQKRRKAARCQLIKAGGLTITRASASRSKRSNLTKDVAVGSRRPFGLLLTFLKKSPLLSKDEVVLSQRGTISDHSGAEFDERPRGRFSPRHRSFSW